jgi:two-component sensor histidine kinase
MYNKIQIAKLIFEKMKNINELAAKTSNFDILLVLFLIAVAALFFVIHRLHTNKLLLAAVLEKKVKLKGVNNLIAKSLDDKEILLKEIHHRVKNNLQLVISLLNIQARQGGDNSIVDFMEKGESRIAVMALIHENLYQSDNLGRVNYQDYLENLILNILKINGRENFSIMIDTENNYLDIQTSVSLGLIVNELLSNSLKHAFLGVNKPQVSITLKQVAKDNYKLLFSDNGSGFDSSVRAKKSLGLTLVQLLVEQLEGTLKCEIDTGTAYEINFKEIT